MLHLLPLLLLSIWTTLFPSSPPQAAAVKPRLLITTDIGGDPDDQQSLIRLLAMAGEFELEGLIASASGTPGELDTAIVRPDLIRATIAAYAEVYPNLLLHDRGFPAPESLLERVKSGNPRRGRDFIGPGHSTEGSAWIRRQIEKDDPRPLNITVWGGQTDLAQALYELKRDLSPSEFRQRSSRLRIYDINDQDRIYDWIQAEFPELFYICSRAPAGVDKREGAYRGMYLGGREELTSPAWITEHVKTNHGPLGALYPMKTWTAPNPHSCLKEGDTPAWFYFLENGLQDAAHPEWGGWGGRFQPAEGAHFRDATDQVDTLKAHARAGVWRWRPAFQNDFAARMDWCRQNYSEANHHPIAVVNGDREKGILYLDVEAGAPLRLDASASGDPDGDRLAFRWWIYPEASGLDRVPLIPQPQNARQKLRFDEAYRGKEIHLILELRDQGEPQLTVYRRVVCRVS